MKNRIIAILLLLVCLSLKSFGQSVTVKGQVVDESGETLIGATIIEVGSRQNGTITDMDGHFILQVRSADSEIEVSYVGFIEQVLKVTPGKNMSITLSESTDLLDEVVVVGYGRQKKITSTGSISEIKSVELKQTPAASIQNALAGKVPGLFQQQASGQPGSDAANIYIRGVSTFTGVSKSPLVLIDDIETEYNLFAQMDPNEVETVTILKDAASTAIYGVKGANGVILVTTRRGTEAKPRITYRGQLGFQNPTVQNKVLDSYESLVLLKEFWMNQGKNPDAQLPGLTTPEALEHFRLGDDPYRYPNVDWYDEILRDFAPQTRHNVDISGGTDIVKYFVSFGYFHQGGIMKELERSEDFNGNFFLNRYNIRTNIDVNATKTTKISFSASGVMDEQNSPNMPDTNSGSGSWPIWRRLAAGKQPAWAYPVRNEDGSYGGSTQAALYHSNPVAALEYGGYERNIRNSINGNLSLTQDLDFITQGLRVKGTLALTNRWGYQRNLKRSAFPEYEYNAVSGELEPTFTNRPPLPKPSVSTANWAPTRKITSNIVLNYDRVFGKHTVSGMGLINWDTFRSGQSMPDNLKGVSARVAYDFENRYMFDFSIGYNGSDRFLEGQRYGTFPAVSAGWNISEEKFMKNIFSKLSIDFLKVRGSYGLTGSDRLAGMGDRYLFLESYAQISDKSNDVYNGQNRYKYGYYFGETPFSIGGIKPETLGNNQVTWEKERKFNVGVEMRMFSQKMSLVFEHFNEERYDILNDRVTIPYIAPTPAPAVNMGRVNNKGYEIELTWRDKIGKDFNYSLRGNLSTAKNIILEKDEAQELYPNLKEVGRPIGQIFGYVFDGFYNSQDEIDAMPDNNRDVEPGDMRYKDMDGNGYIDIYDRGPIGYSSTVPQITYGFTVAFDYKNVDFSMLFQGAAKGSMTSNLILEIGGVNGRPREIHKYRWTPENREDAKFPRLGGVGNYETSTFWLRPRDYLRLKNIEVGYNLPKPLVNKFYLHSARLFANGSNLFTLSKMSIYDVDPESNSGSYSGYGSYPQMRVFNVGIQLVF